MKTMNKYVIVLGAGRGQIPIMELCRKYGYKVIAVSPKGDYPGFKVADISLFEDVKNKEAVLKVAREYDIKGILTDQLDEGVPTAAYVSEKMNLNGIAYDVSLKFTNKSLMRKTAENAGIIVPKSFVVNDAETAIKIINDQKDFAYPLIIKPVDSSASRGIHVINESKDLFDCFADCKSYSKSGEVIIEQFISGKEYVVDAFTKDYRVKNLIVGHRDYFDIPDTFIPNATVFLDADSAVSPVEEKIKEVNEKIIREFGLKFGVTHAEFLYVEETNTVYLVEIAARGGGVFISSDLIPLACGVNANDLLVREVLGLHNENEIILKSGASAYFCYLVPKGEVISILNAEKVPGIAGVQKAFFDNIELGMKTKSIRDKSSRKGPILVSGKTKKDCYAVIEKVKQTLDIKVKTKNGVENIIWN